MMNLQQETAKILAPCLYVLNKTGRISKHHLSKILYFADKSHVAKYGRTLSGQKYIAMQNGPVPSQIYDFIKHVQGISAGHFLTEHVQYVDFFIGFEPKYYVFAKVEADMQFLSISAVNALDESIAKYRNSSFALRTDESHDAAWQEAWNRPGRDKEMSIIEIAKSAGANAAMIDYIKARM
jgi:uncharacterized phage-associated protein